MSTLCGILLLCWLSFTVNAQDKKAPWPQLSAYHSVMSGTFHPAEEGNLKPIREKSGELVTKAEEWKKSTAPAAYNKPGLKEKLDLLVTESKGVDKLVKDNAKDEELTKALTKLHDRFHEIVGICTGESHEGHDHGHDHGHEGHKH